MPTSIDKFQKPTVLFIEDEAPIREMVRFSLELEGFSLLEAGDAKEAEKILEEQLPDLILLDWMLPGTSGIEIAKHYKKRSVTREIPIIMLTARAAEEYKVAGFEAGADDYIVKPFSARELLARIKAVLRRGLLVSPQGQIIIDDMVIDINRHQVHINNTPIKLSPIEYQLLHFLASHKEHAYSREQLLDRVWGTNVFIDDRTVDVQIRRLRKALEPHGYATYIQTIRGIGYKFSKAAT